MSEREHAKDAVGDGDGPTLADVAHFTTKWFIESGGLVRGSYSGRRLRVAVDVQRRSEGEKDIQCEVRAAREQGDSLEVHAHRLGAKGADALARELRGDQKIRSLVLSDTDLGPDGAAPVAEVLRYNECITELTLQLNGLGDRGACTIAHAFTEGSTCILRKLALEEEGIGEVGTRAIAAALSPRGARGPALALLIKLSLRGNPVGTTGASILAKALQVNCTLESLDLSSCRLTGLGAARLAEALPHNRTLLELRLVRNGIPVTGALAMAAGLLHNKALESLYLGANPCSSEGWLGYPQAGGGRSPVPGLVQAISRPPLTELSLFGTGLGNAGLAEMARLLVDSVCKLESLDLGDNRLSSAGAMELAKVLPKQRTITTLGLWGNAIGSAGKPDADALARSIQRNKRLLRVSLDGNPIENQSMPMSIIQRAMKRNMKHAAQSAREAELQGSDPRTTAINLTGSTASSEEKIDLVPSLKIPSNSSGQLQQKPSVSLGAAGQTPREVRELDADGRTGYTPRPVDANPDASIFAEASGTPTASLSTTATAAALRPKLLKHRHPSKRLLHNEHNEYAQVQSEVARTGNATGDDQAMPLSNAVDAITTATAAAAGTGTNDPDKPDSKSHQQKRHLRAPVLAENPLRSEASASSIGLVTSAAAEAARSVTVFIDNQTTMPLVLARKYIGPKDGRWTWSDQLVPARVRQNEQAVMASESVGGTSRQRRPVVATRAAATVVYRLEGEKTEQFKGVLHLEGVAAVANAALMTEVHGARNDINVHEPGPDEDALVGGLLDALAEAASSIRVIVRRDQVQVRATHEVADADGSGSSKMTGWLGFSVAGAMVWRPALPEERIAASKAATPSAQIEPERAPEGEPQLEPEPQPKADDDGPKPAELHNWETKTLEDFGSHLELVTDSGEDGTMSLAFLIDDGAVASLLDSPDAGEVSSNAAESQSSSNEPSASARLSKQNVLSRSLAKRFGDALSLYGPEWLSNVKDGTSDKHAVTDVLVLPGYQVPAPQSCTVELSWAHEGRKATAKWLVKHRVEGQDLAVKVSVDGAGSASKLSQDELGPFCGEEHSMSTKDPHLQFCFVVEPVKAMNRMAGAAVAQDEDLQCFQSIEEDPHSLISVDATCTPPAAHLVARLRCVRYPIKFASLHSCEQLYHWPL